MHFNSYGEALHRLNLAGCFALERGPRTVQNSLRQPRPHLRILGARHHLARFFDVDSASDSHASFDAALNLQSASNRLVVLQMDPAGFRIRFDFHGYFLLSLEFCS